MAHLAQSYNWPEAQMHLKKTKLSILILQNIFLQLKTSLETAN